MIHPSKIFVDNSGGAIVTFYAPANSVCYPIIHFAYTMNIGTYTDTYTDIGTYTDTYADIGAALD